MADETLNNAPGDYLDKYVESIRQAYKPPEITTQQQITQAALGLLPILAGGLIRGREGVHAGAAAGLAGLSSYQDIMNKQNELAQRLAESEAKLYGGIGAGLIKQNQGLDIYRQKQALEDIQWQEREKAKIEGQENLIDYRKRLEEEDEKEAPSESEIELVGQVAANVGLDTELVVNTRGELKTALNTLSLLQRQKEEDRRASESAAQLLGQKLRPVPEARTEKLSEFAALKQKLLVDLGKLEALGDPNLLVKEFAQKIPNTDFNQLMKSLTIDGRLLRSNIEAGVATDRDVNDFIKQLSPSPLERLSQVRERFNDIIRYAEDRQRTVLSGWKASGSMTYGLEKMLGFVGDKAIPDWLADSPIRTASTVKGAREALSSGAATNIPPATSITQKPIERPGLVFTGKYDDLGRPKYRRAP